MDRTSSGRPLHPSTQSPELLTSIPFVLPEPAIRVKSPPPPQHFQWMTLTCGSKSFRIRRASLQKHSIFAQHMRFHPYDTEIELTALHGDEEMTVHIVTYLENPDIFPLFRSAQWGFHYALYHHLQKAARALELYDLHDWIAEKRYVQALKTVVHTTIEEIEPGQLPTTAMYDGNAEVTVNILQKTRYFHFCPRGVPAHRVERDSPNRCGRRCEAHREHGSSRLEEEPYAEVLTVAKSVVFDAAACMRGTRAEAGTDEDGG
ncbi:hypothetical protein J1614_001224 [Plenodomus biglobosus]|nr:hypothetical protein J1614_001224 [Plenodomus biglobosus]